MPFGGVFNKVTDTLGLTDSEAAERATRQGYATLTAAQQEALDYLREANAIPQEIREMGYGFNREALQNLAGAYGLGDSGAQQAFFDNLTMNPLYEATMSGLDDAQENYLRTQSATGDLRGGASIKRLAELNRDTKNQALMNALNYQIGGFQDILGRTALPDYTRDIASGIGGVGQTQAQGQIAVGQAQQNAAQAGLNNLLGLGSLAVGSGLGVPGGLDFPSFGSKPQSPQASLYRQPNI